MSDSGKSTLQGRIATVRRSWTIEAPAASVWAEVTRDNSMPDWNDRVATAETVRGENGLPRRKFVLKAPEGQSPVVISETELFRSNLTMTMGYSADLAGLPILDYLARLTVTPEGDRHCTVEIGSRFFAVTKGVPPGFDAREAVADFYVACFIGLQRRMRDIGA